MRYQGRGKGDGDVEGRHENAIRVFSNSKLTLYEFKVLKVNANLV